MAKEQDLASPQFSPLLPGPSEMLGNTQTNIRLPAKMQKSPGLLEQGQSQGAVSYCHFVLHYVRVGFCKAELSSAVLGSVTGSWNIKESHIASFCRGVKTPQSRFHAYTIRYVSR